jgi:hypothetical protein
MPRLLTRHVLLTYSQVGDRNKLDLFNHLKTLRDVSHFILGEERHQDGGKHFHCYFVFIRRKDIDPATFFNWDNLHPNIESVRQQLKQAQPVVNYVTKEDQSPLLFPTHHEWPWNKSNVWSLVVNATSRQEAEAIIKQEKPRDWIINGNQIEAALEKMFPSLPPPAYTFPLESFTNVPEEMDNWLSENFGMYPL